MTPRDRRRVLVVSILAWAFWLVLMATLGSAQGCATWSVDRPVCGFRRGAAEVSYCCEAGISGELSVGVGALDVTGLVEGCARWRVVTPEPEQPRVRR